MNKVNERHQILKNHNDQSMGKYARNLEQNEVKYKFTHGEKEKKREMESLIIVII